MSEFKSEVAWSEQGDFENYRTISRSAVTALILAMLSLSAFASPALWIAPILAGFLALVALRGIRKTEHLTGAGIAGLAIFLSAFTLVAAPTRHLSRRHTLTTQAREHVDSWCKLVIDGKLPQAYELTLEYTDRNAAGVDLETLYGPQEIELDIEDPTLKAIAMSKIVTKGQQLNKFFEDDGAAVVVRSKSLPTFVKMLTVSTRHGVDKVVMQFAGDGGEYEAVIFEVERRYIPPINESHWRIAKIHHFDFPGGSEPQ